MSGFRLDGRDDRVIRCEDCGQQAGQVILGPYPVGGRPGRLFAFYGTGWHRGTDGTYRLERHARKRVRAGKLPLSAHPRVPTPGGGWVDHLQSPELLTISIECGRCASTAGLDPVATRLDGMAFIRG